MPAKNELPDIDALLDTVICNSSTGLDVSSKPSSFLDEESFSIDANTTEASTKHIEIINLPAGEIDPRLKLLSHSSRTLLKKCGKKYQLYRLNSEQQEEVDPVKSLEQRVTFAYGKAVGIGIQSTLEDKSEDQTLLDVFLEWDTDLLEATPRQNKSFWLAMFATQKFINMRTAGYLTDYELVYYKGKPTVELAFQIVLPEGFKYRGFVDAVLRHRVTGEIVVLENKTTSGTAQSAQYKNSGQALGYSVVLDIIFPLVSSYTVLYLVYESKSMEYKELPFTKSLLQRALWLQELLIDTQIIKLYESYGTYPMEGSSCFDFFKECEYLGVCTLSTTNLTKPLTQAVLDKIAEDEAKYTFTLDFYDLVEAQIAKGEL